VLITCGECSKFPRLCIGYDDKTITEANDPYNIPEDARIVTLQ